MDMISKIVELINSIDKAQKIIAIDGRAASGKTTLANKLSVILNAGLIHTDDFFLPLELRNEKRLSEAGGNIHYERFITEVLPWLRQEAGFSYNAFDCKAMSFAKRVDVPRGRVRIVEGSYSQHPRFSDYADIKIFVTVSPENQYNRIVQRNGKERAEQFKSRWIPMEEKYFSEFKISDRADLIVCSDCGKLHI